MGAHRNSTKLVAVMLGFVALGAACGDDDNGSAGGTKDSWCALMEPANEVERLFDDLASFDPAALEDALNRVEEVNEQLVPAAPPEIAGPAAVLSESTQQLIDAIAAADYSLFDADLSAISDPASEAATDEANAQLDAYSVENCGQPFGDDSTDGADDSGDSSDPDDGSFDPSAGTIREQLVNQFLAIGLTQAEAECIADGVDPTDSAVLEGDQAAILALFEACDIPLSRLAELGG